MIVCWHIGAGLEPENAIGCPLLSWPHLQLQWRGVSVCLLVVDLWDKVATAVLILEWEKPTSQKSSFENPYLFFFCRGWNHMTTFSENKAQKTLLRFLNMAFCWTLLTLRKNNLIIMTSLYFCHSLSLAVLRATGVFLCGGFSALKNRSLAVFFIMRWRQSHWFFLSLFPKTGFLCTRSLGTSLCCSSNRRLVPNLEKHSQHSSVNFIPARTLDHQMKCKQK